MGCYFKVEEVGRDEVGYRWLWGERVREMRKVCWDGRDVWVWDM